MPRSLRIGACLRFRDSQLGSVAVRSKLLRDQNNSPSGPTLTQARYSDFPASFPPPFYSPSLDFTATMFIARSEYGELPSGTTELAVMLTYVYQTEGSSKFH